MKMYVIIFITIIISATLFLAFSNKSNNEIEIGSKAPNFKLFNQDSELVYLSDYYGKNLVIYFFPKVGKIKNSHVLLNLIKR